MIVIADTSCLCYLARLGCASVLENLYGEVIIPPAVASELLAGVSAHQEIDSLLNTSWLQVRTLEYPPAADDFPQNIDPEEAQAIRLAKEMRADFLLIDDMAGRRMARAMGIPIIGILGLLSEARRQNLVGPLRPIFIQLVEELGFRATSHLIESVLKEVGE